MKKGQVSIFIIFAIVIVAVIAIFIVLKGNSPNNQEITREIQPIYDYFDNCIRDTGKNALYSIGRSGGYSHYPNYSTENGIGYYYNIGKNNMPSKEFIELELSSYMDNMLEYCAADLNQFGDFIIKVSWPKTKTKIEDNNVVFNVKYPLSISKGNSSYSLSNFNVNIDSRLGEIYYFSQNITMQQIKDGGKLCLTCIDDIVNKKDFYFEMNDYDNETEIFTIVDKKYKLNDNDYRFSFANRYEI